MNTDLLHPDRLFPVDLKTREMARELYQQVKKLPIISPHGHTDPAWFAQNKSFGDPVSLLLVPDHYLLRMLYSQGLDLTQFGVLPKVGKKIEAMNDKRQIWQNFAANFYLFRGTPSDLWLKHVFHEVFGLTKPFTPSTAAYYFDVISEKLSSPEFLPRALFKRFNIEVLATTDSPLDSLEHHQQIKQQWDGRVIPTYRPDGVIDPEHEDFKHNLQRFSEVSGEDCFSWQGYLTAHRKRRTYFKQNGATATDHGHPTARALKLSDHEASALFAKVTSGTFNHDDSENFRAHMLWRMAEMSQDDKLVMQIHPGSYRKHNQWLFENYGRDKGDDIPMRIDYTEPLRPLLNSFGNNRDFSLILFTLDESTYSRELAPLAGHYPCLKLGPAWWFHDSPEGMLRHRKQCLETAGFYNMTGFIDDTRAFFSIPARHDVARRIDARILAELTAEHRLSQDEAKSLMTELNTTLARGPYRL